MKRLLSVLCVVCVPLFPAFAQVVADFESGLGGFAVGASSDFGTAVTSVARIPDPTHVSGGVMQVNLNFAGGASAKGATLLKPAGGLPSHGARFITYWVYVPDSIPANYNVQVFAQDNKNFKFYGSLTPGSAIPKMTWFPLSLDLAQTGINDPQFDLVGGSIFQTGIQIDNLNQQSVTWKDSIYVDNVALVGAQPVLLGDFETGLNGFKDEGFGPALTGLKRVADPTARSSGVMQLNWNFPRAHSKGAMGVEPNAPKPRAHFVTYWVFLPDSTMPDSLSFSIYAQDGSGGFVFRDNNVLARNVPKKVWYPLSLDLAQAAITSPQLNIATNNLIKTGIQIHSYNYADSVPVWLDSLYVDNAALLYDTVASGPPPKKLLLSDFNTPGDIGAFSTQSFGPAFTSLTNGVDTTNAANRVLVVNAAFDTGAAVKGAMARSNFAFFKQGDTSATDIAFDVYVPPTMPDSARFDLALSGPATGNNWVQDEHMLGGDFQKGMWNTLKFSISGHIADHTITSPRLSATFYIQVYYQTAKKWSGKLFFDNLTLLGIDALTSVATNGNSPYQYKLFNNYPNPFNPATTIRYELKVGGSVSLKVYDILGQEVATLVNEHQGAGLHSVVFDAQAHASGVYFYTLRAGSFTKTDKMTLLK